MDRFLLFGIILVAVLELTAGQTKNCCSPDQWQGLQSVTIEGQWGPEYVLNFISIEQVVFKVPNIPVVWCFN